MTTRYGGYLHREVPEEDVELSHVGPGTPCGEYLHRYWQPICFSDELKDLPHRVKILGEELMVFRNLSGAVGAFTVPLGALELTDTLTKARSTGNREKMGV